MLSEEPLFPLFIQIQEYIAEQPGYRGAKDDIYLREERAFNIGNGKRIYQAKISTNDACIRLGIREDGGTRTVFNGRIYTLDHFMAIDMLTR